MPKQSGAQDGNTGLVKLALSAHAMRAIQRLTQTYLTLPLAAIAVEAGLPSAADAEHYLLRCVAVLRPVCSQTLWEQSCGQLEGSDVLRV